MDGFETKQIETPEASIHVRLAGHGPAVLLLHGFPQSHRMWRDIAPVLARRLTVVCADLRGYGDSSCPTSTPDHEPYSKRAMARDMVSVMDRLGFSRFTVIGHDRGARVAYRLALDQPELITRLAVLDIVPTSITWERADSEFALALWPWSLLAQPAPLPEKFIQAAPEAILDFYSERSASPIFAPEDRSAYLAALRDPARVHAMCEDYRAGATLDRLHDTDDRKSGKRIECPVLVLWAGQGFLAKAHKNVGGPLNIWKEWASDVRGYSLDAGHFFPEQQPMQTAEAIGHFCINSN